MKIFAYNINFKANRDVIIDLFAKYGKIADFNMAHDRETKKFRGFVFVEYENDNDALDAINNINGMEFMGRYIGVKIHEEKQA